MHWGIWPRSRLELGTIGCTLGLRKGGHGQIDSSESTLVSPDCQVGESVIYSGGTGKPAKILQKIE